MVRAAYRFIRGNKEVEGGVRHLLAVDEVLSGVIRRVGKFSMRREKDELTALVDAVCSQQLSGKAAEAVMGRVMALFPGGVTAEKMLVVSEERLREAGLSRAKVVYVKDLARRVAEGSLIFGELERLSDEEVVRKLSEVKGIGRWTAEMFLMFTLRRWDVLPLGDLGIRKAFNILYGSGGELEWKEMERIAEKWRPYRTIASWYLWRAVEK